MSAYFPVLLVVCVFSAALAYLGTLQGRGVESLNLAMLAYISALLGFVLGLAVATLLPSDYQSGGFWVIAALAALAFYWALQRGHRDLKWSLGSRQASSCSSEPS